MVAASLPASNEDIDTFLADYQSATEVAANMDAESEDSAEGKGTSLPLLTLQSALFPLALFCSLLSPNIIFLLTLHLTHKKALYCSKVWHCRLLQAVVLDELHNYEMRRHLCQGWIKGKG